MTTTASGDGLAIDGIHLGYGSQPVLSDISVRIPRGQVLAMMGPSGCGKTTLGRIVAGFLVPSSGTIAVHGTAMVGPGRSVPAHRRGIGMVPQEGALFPHLTVAGNVGFGLARRSPERQARIAECLALVGLEGFGPRRVHELSGGQQQRVAVARALAPRPDLIIMDEPFSALDTNLRGTTRDLVFEAIATQQTTVMLITHDGDEALSSADQIALIANGKITQIGSPDDIYLRPVGKAAAAASGPIVELSAHADGASAATAIGPVALRSRAAGTGSVIVRPEQIVLRATTVDAAVATVTAVHRTGATLWARCTLSADPDVMINVPIPTDMTVGTGDAVDLHLTGTAAFEPAVGG